MAAAEIASSVPLRSKSFCAVGIVKTAKVADPSDLTLPYCATPTSLNGRTGPRLVTRTVCPISKCWSSAVARSITTSFEALGQRPEVRRSGLNRGSEKSTPNPNDGAPLVEIALPLRVEDLGGRLVGDVPGRGLDVRQLAHLGEERLRDRRRLRRVALEVEPRLAADDGVGARVRVAEDFLNALSIASVSANVPLTIATPRTIASAVRNARSLRPARPRSATRITSA